MYVYVGITCMWTCAAYKSFAGFLVCTTGKAPEAVYMKSQEGSNEQRAQSQTHTMVMQHAEALACPVSNKPMPKGAWTKEEDETDMRLVGFYGPTRCPPLILMPPRASDCIHQCRLEHY